MSRILKVSQGDYRLQVQTGGTITLDTGSNTGTVVITGNVDIKGTSTTVESTNTTVNDNILQLNYGQTGNGISGVLNYVSGITVARGNYPTAELLFSEAVIHFEPLSATTVGGTWVMQTANGALTGLQVNTITNDGAADLAFDLHGSSNAIAIVNSGGFCGTSGHTEVTDATNYAAIALQPYHIPNVQFMYNYVAATGGVATVDKIYTPTTGGIGSATSSIQAIGPLIYMKTSGVSMVTLSTGGLSVNDINIVNSTISGTNASYNLVLTANSNNVEISSILNFDDQTPENIATYGYTVGGKTKLCSMAVAGAGKTGLFFTNLTATDELVAKNRALLFSMLF